ncbi:MAG: ROK family transcriptional regulator [Desulfobacteraceae bacterium]
MRAIWLNSGISRVDISRDLELDKSTVTLIVNDLIEMGLVYPIAEGKAGPQGGRRPIKLTINKDFACVVGIEIQPQTCTMIGTDLDGQIFESSIVPININIKNLDEIFIPLVEEFLKGIEKTNRKIIGLGFGVAGVVDPFKGIIHQSIPLNITSPYDFYSTIGNHFDAMCQIENDANCCAWGELTYHRHADLKNFLFVLIELRKNYPTDVKHGGLAVGMGVVIDGKVHHGGTFSAGEFRSILWKKDNINQFSISNTASLKIEKDSKIRKRLFTELSKHIALFVNTLNLSHVFIGGDVLPYQDDLANLLNKEIQNNWVYSNQVDCSIHFSSPAHLSVAFGAASMILNQLFADREIQGQEGLRLPLGIDLMASNM